MAWEGYALGTTRSAIGYTPARRLRETPIASF